MAAVDEVDVLVVGAGLAGLSAAVTAARAGRSVLVLEGNEQIGGRVRTEEVDGLLLDRGFQVLNPAYPELKRLGILPELDLRPFAAGLLVATESGITRLGDPRRVPSWLPDGLSGGVTALIDRTKMVVALAKVWQRARIENPVDRPGNTRDSLLAAGVPPHVYESILRPFLTGVFFTDPQEVGAGYGDFVVRSFIDGNPSLPARGMGALPIALARRLPPGTIRTGVRVERVRANEVDTADDTIKAKKVIVAVDARTAHQWFPRLELPKMLDSVTWYHTAPNTPRTDRAILVDAMRRGPVINSAPVSQVAPGYSSAGRTLMATTAIGSDSSESMRVAIEQHLALLWGPAVADWHLVRAEVVRDSLPLAAVGAPLSRPVQVIDGVWLAGDYLATPSQEGALRTGRLAAESALTN